jgi:hypothetical protein
VRFRVAGAAVIAAAVVAFALAGCGSNRAHRTTTTSSADGRPPSDPQVVVTVSPREASIPVPRSYLGISTEYWGINHFGQYMGEYERVLSLLRVPGNGPFVLRIGGDSASHSVIDMPRAGLPAGVFDVRAPWFRRVSTLVDALDARVIFDLGVISDTPLMAHRWAHAATTELPRGSLMDYEIGNEPDLYSRRYWASVFSPLGLLVRDLPVSITPSSYARLFDAYSPVLSRLSPRTGLAGPAVAYPALALNWISTLLKGPHPGLRLVTAHEYPYSACAPSLSPLYATVGRVLSEDATAEMAADIRPSVLIAHDAGYPFRLTELNSVTCGGKPGVSNTFATALWAPDALFELMRVGVNGVNIHVRAYAVNGAFVLGRKGIVARPLLYGMILFARMLGPDARLLDAHLAAPAAAHVKAWAVRVGSGELRVLLINKGRHAVHTMLRLPAVSRASVERLLAPSVRATGGETLDGQYLGSRERWVGRPSHETVTPSGNRYELTVPATSAALVRVQIEARAR